VPLTFQYTYRVLPGPSAAITTLCLPSTAIDGAEYVVPGAPTATPDGL